jgi:hypothetical protein
MFFFPQILGIRFVIIMVLGIVVASLVASTIYYKGKNTHLENEVIQLTEKYDNCIENLKALDLALDDAKEQMDALKDFYDNMPKPPSGSGVLNNLLDKASSPPNPNTGTKDSSPKVPRSR